jgi:hypothetical protein
VYILYSRHDCEQFDLAEVNIHVMEQLKTDLEDTQSNYKIYEEFDTELRKLGEMEWILFRLVLSRVRRTKKARFPSLWFLGHK